MPQSNVTVDTSKLKTLIHRQYEYFYTGKNVDILKFDLNFNTLFYQAVPLALAVANNIQDTGGTKVRESSGASVNPVTSDITPIGPRPIRDSIEVSNPTVSGMPNATEVETDAYNYLAKALHEAIVTNVDQLYSEGLSTSIVCRTL